jgi:hypothetical protein
VAEDKTRNALRKDDRLLALRVLAGVSLMPTSQLTAFEESLNGSRAVPRWTSRPWSRPPSARTASSARLPSSWS